MHKDYTLPSGSSCQDSNGARLVCFQPTHSTFQHDGTTYHWNARYHRKGRYPAVYSSMHQQGEAPRLRLLPIWFGYPFGDISYWVGLVFTLGCVAWVINAHYALYEHGGAVAANAEQALTTAAAAALVGGTLFEIGSWLLYWEALNPEPDVVTGRELQQQADAKANSQSHNGVDMHADAGSNAAASTAAGKQAAADANSSHIAVIASSADSMVPGMLCYTGNERPRLVAFRQMQQLMQQQQQQPQPRRRWTSAAAAPAGDSKHHNDVEAPSADAASSAAQHPSNTAAAAPKADVGGAAGKGVNARQPKAWRWWGLRLHDMGFTASFLQLIGATIFWVPCIFGAPTVYPSENISNRHTWDGMYWLLQVIGATFFIASSLLFMLEVQPAWWRPKPLLIGWHVGFWNLIGAIGFWLSGFYGFWAVPSGKYQLGGTVLSTFWGSYAFLIGSYLQLLESVNKHPQSLSYRQIAPCWLKKR